MRIFGLTIGVLIILVAAVSFAAPDRRLALEGAAMTPSGLYAIAVLRVALGVMLVLAAPASRGPRLLRALGIVVMVAGVVTPGFGVARAQAVVDWLTTAGRLWMRLDAVAGMALGGFLVYMFQSRTTRRSD
jgi:hypothetical protein